MRVPLLLDPTQWGDPDLLAFTGAGQPTSADPRDMWRSCERRLKDLRGIVEAQRHQNNTDAGGRLKDICRDMDDLYDEESEFTATAWACVKELNAEMIVRLAKEMARSLE